MVKKLSQLTPSEFLHFLVTRLDGSNPSTNHPDPRHLDMRGCVNEIGMDFGIILLYSLDWTGTSKSENH